jgi:hypothetical protein
MNDKTKTYIVPVNTMRRWKLMPEDATLLKLALMNFKFKLPELERRRKSLLNRMKGDFFLVLYAPGSLPDDQDVPTAEQVNGAVEP